MNNAGEIWRIELGIAKLTARQRHYIIGLGYVTIWREERRPVKAIEIAGRGCRNTGNHRVQPRIRLSGCSPESGRWARRRRAVGYRARPEGAGSGTTRWNSVKVKGEKEEKRRDLPEARKANRANKVRLLRCSIMVLARSDPPLGSTLTTDT